MHHNVQGDHGSIVPRKELKKRLHPVREWKEGRNKVHVYKSGNDDDDAGLRRRLLLLEKEENVTKTRNFYSLLPFNVLLSLFTSFLKNLLLPSPPIHGPLNFSSIPIFLPLVMASLYCLCLTLWLIQYSWIKRVIHWIRKETGHEQEVDGAREGKALKVGRDDMEWSEDVDNKNKRDNIHNDDTWQGEEKERERERMKAKMKMMMKDARDSQKFFLFLDQKYNFDQLGAKTMKSWRDVKRHASTALNIMDENLNTTNHMDQDGLPVSEKQSSLACK